MNIWIDIANAPHVNFFKRLIDDWTSAGHNVIITARPLSNTIPLLQKHNIEYTEIGRHYGKNLLAKSIGFFVRCFQLWSFLRKQNIDVAISQSSFYSPPVARALNCFCVYTNDNEFAKGNHLGFVFAQKILLPEALKEWADSKYFREKVEYYDGVKEGIYLHELIDTFNRPINKQKDQHIFFRPEPWTAQYHNNSNNEFSALLSELARKYLITILPRGEEQSRYFKQLNNPRINVQETALTLTELAKKCDIFIGGGGSMSREFSLLGVQTLSTYQGELLAVDKYLIAAGVMKHSRELEASAIISRLQQTEPTANSSKLQKLGVNAYNLIMKSIKN